jgi:serine/threonine-protein kinase HipA
VVACNVAAHRPAGQGLAASCTLEYLPDYVLEHLDCSDEATVSCTLFPSTTIVAMGDCFFLDLLPSGYGRDTCSLY